MDRIEIVVPRASGEAVFLRFDEKWLLDLGIDKMGMNGGPQIHLQKAPNLSQEWGEGQSPDNKYLFFLGDGIFWVSTSFIEELKLKE